MESMPCRPKPLTSLMSLSHAPAQQCRTTRAVSTLGNDLMVIIWQRAYGHHSVQCHQRRCPSLAAVVIVNVRPLSAVSQYATAKQGQLVVRSGRYRNRLTTHSLAAMRAFLGVRTAHAADLDGAGRNRSTGRRTSRSGREGVQPVVGSGTWSRVGAVVGDVGLGGRSTLALFGGDGQSLLSAEAKRSTIAERCAT